MEMMFAILFFSVAGAVCLQLFAKAHALSRDATVLNEAVTSCQSAASILDAEGMDALPEYLTRTADNRYLNADVQDPAFYLQITEDGGAYHIQALKTGSDEEIYSLQLVKRNR